MCVICNIICNILPSYISYPSQPFVHDSFDFVTTIEIQSLWMHFERFKYRQREDNQAQVPLSRDFKVRIFPDLRFQQLRHVDALNPEKRKDSETSHP